MEIKAVGSFAVTRPAASTVQAAEPQVAPPAEREAPKSQAGLYISPVIRYDQAAKLAVILFRDSDTGETRDQIPAERVVEEYRRAGGRSAGTDTTSGESPTGYERVSTDGGTGGEGREAGSTTTTTTPTGAGPGYGGATSAPVPAGFGAPGGGTSGTRVSVTV